MEHRARIPYFSLLLETVAQNHRTNFWQKFNLPFHGNGLYGSGNEFETRTLFTRIKVIRKTWIHTFLLICTKTFHLLKFSSSYPRLLLLFEFLMFQMNYTNRRQLKLSACEINIKLHFCTQTIWIFHYYKCNRYCLLKSRNNTRNKVVLTGSSSSCPVPVEFKVVVHQIINIGKVQSFIALLQITFLSSMLPNL